MVKKVEDDSIEVYMGLLDAWYKRNHGRVPIKADARTEPGYGSACHPQWQTNQRMWASYKVEKHAVHRVRDHDMFRACLLVVGSPVLPKGYATPAWQNDGTPDYNTWNRYQEALRSYHVNLMPMHESHVSWTMTHNFGRAYMHWYVAMEKIREEKSRQEVEQGT